MRKLVMSIAVALTATASVTGVALRSDPAQAQQNNCNGVIQFDTTLLQTNYAAQLSILNTVTQSNYQQSKQDLGLSIPEYFTGSFSEFEERRSELRSSFSQQQLTTFSQNLQQRLVSPQSARMYEVCMRGNRPFVAWISSTGVTSNYVTVTVKNQLAGSSSIAYTVAGATPVNQPAPLTSGSEQTLIFNAPRNRDFILVVNGQNAQTGASYSPPPLELPAYVEYRREAETRTVSGTGRCGAGCQGNTAGCQEHQNATLAAPSGFRLQPNTRHLSRRTVVGGPGVNIDPPWSWVSTPAGSSAPNVMVGTPGNCDGMSPHTQGIVDYQFSVDAVRYRMVQVSS